MKVPDFSERKRALTDFDTNLLVEAAAGTGKTSLMAGRVALMLAGGYNPASIAAITFTELAASELEHKIRWTVAELREGREPPALAGVVDLPLDRKALANLNDAAPRIDQIAATTIHGFCKAILQSHGVDVALDPGARVVDETIADAIFDEVLTNWLYNRLAGEDTDDDPIAVLSKDDPLQIVKHVRELASLRRKRLDARAPYPRFDERLDLEFAQAVDDFARWHAGPRVDTWTADLIADLQKLSTSLHGSFGERHSFAKLWRYAHPPRIGGMPKRGIDLPSYDRMEAWQSAYGREEGQRLGREAETHYETIATTYRTLIGRLAQMLVASLSSSLDAVLENYSRRKRESAVLDFDDLLRLARDLVCRNPDIRRSVAARYQHILVDEFQDTDPLQAEIVFCLSADSQPAKWDAAVLRTGSIFLVGDPKQAIYRFRGADVETYLRARGVIKNAPNGDVIEITANFRSRTVATRILGSRALLRPALTTA
jgi:ATP-dependent exoDNAse (exonuclease V) beta subunit